MTSTFTIDGPLRGYSVRAGMYHDPAWKAWKQMVRMLANAAGVPETPTETTRISVEIYWKKKARVDGSNVVKLIEDAVFPQDRLLEGGSWFRRLNTGEEKAIVTVGW